MRSQAQGTVRYPAVPHGRTTDTIENIEFCISNMSFFRDEIHEKVCVCNT